MTEARAVALSLLVLLGTVAVVAPASLALPGQSTTAAVGAQAQNDTSMGGQVSSFMHASSGQASEEVQSGMWNAAYANASNRSAVVDGRVADIATRLDALHEEKRELIAAERNGTISRAEYQARMSALVGRMAALNRSIDETERQARSSGANVTRVATLRTQASAMTGPEVSAMARSLAGGPPEGVPAGPPDHAGPPDDAGPAGNETAPGQGGGNGPDGNPGNGPDGAQGNGPDGNPGHGPDGNKGGGKNE